MLHYLIGAAALWLSPAPAAQSAPVLTCMYDALSPSDRQQNWDVTLPGATAEQKAATTTANRAAAAKCGMAGWSRPRQQMAGSYTIARISLDHIVAALAAQAVRPEMFHRTVAGLSEPVRAAIIQQAVGNELYAELLQKLRAQGLPEGREVDALASNGLRNATIMFEVERAWPTLP
jgi:L-amino acid N-acyltransferase YncA